MKSKLFKAVLLCSTLASLSLAVSPITTFAAETPETQQSDEQNVTDVTEEQYLQNISGIEEVSGQKLLSLVQSNDSTYYLFLGFKECPYCREFSKVMNEFTGLANYPIYYVNVKKQYSDISSDELSVVNQFLASKVGFTATPTVVKVVDGKIVMNYVGSETTLEQLIASNAE